MSWTTESASDQTAEAVVARVSWNRDGLLPAIIQDDVDGAVLMLGYMDDEALRRTLTEGRVTFWSRSRQEYWRKGDTSGHRQYVKTAALDCDGDTLLVRVEQLGPACHTGARACFDVDPLQPVVGSSTDDAEFPASAPTADAGLASSPDTAGESTE